MSPQRIVQAGIFSLPLFVGAAFGQGYSPAEAIAKMTADDGLKVTMFAHEPDVRQAIFVKCDDRGRLWTIQYLQYPNPAGLKRVQVDRWSRTVYDRVPKPPPHGPRGADRITICEDVDGDGRADKFKDFVDGLNLVTGIAFGHGGVFVLNVPYLLYYPDRDNNDVPDSDPRVLLQGFGMEDAQSMSNHLTWGPDGWLYGVNGSTTTCNVRGIEFQSGVWRFHPITQEFELFSEGGYNCYGLTFDENGELLVSTNGGPFLHAMQGAYYYKSFGKHGPLHNLYAYHHFPILQCDQVPGGPPTGGTIYLGSSFPNKFRGKFIAGNFLGHSASWWNVHAKGSTFRATFGDVLIDAHDTWFGPTDMCVGPDGAMYVSDFHDQRTAHPDPDANWDLSNGRLYKISAKGLSSAALPDVRELSSRALVELFHQENRWLNNRARMELARRQDASVAEPLRQLARQEADGPLALRGLWALNAVGRFDDAIAGELLAHSYPYVRYWVVRLVGDRRAVSPELAGQLAALASRETNAAVTAQLACTAKRLSAEHALLIIDQLLKSPLAVNDERIPWLVWWAIEGTLDEAPLRVASRFATADAWENQSTRDNALRLIRRWAAQGDAAGYSACLRLLRSTSAAHQGAARNSLCLGLSERSVGLHGIGQGGLFDQQAAEDDAPSASARQFERLTDDLRSYVDELWNRDQSNLLALELAIRCGNEEASAFLLRAVRDRGVSEERSIQLLRLLGKVGGAGASEAVLPLLRRDAKSSVALAVVDVVDGHGDVDDAASLVSRYAEFPPEVQSRLHDLFFGRANVALQFLGLYEGGTFSAEQVSMSQVARLALHKDEEINGLVQKIWGKVGRGSSEEVLATMRRLSNDLRAGTGNLENGKTLFTKHCANCHQLHGQGEKIGPDLTTANRKDRAALLANIVDPSAVIRREYTSYVVLTDSGRTITGMLAEENGAAITILDAQNRRITIPRDEVEDLAPSEISLMAERILDPLSPQELRDLFHYLEN
ncbi:c-type cytochrome [Pirellulales bacterium]|nr:c-type cytochrome [Pirellulales bacterium]